MHDIVIRHGDVVDGTGAAPVRADVAIDGDRITEVGAVDRPGRAGRSTPRGRIVTPGFVDIHTHLDAQLFWDPAASSSCWHGVTTVVLGNCGVTFAPVRPGQEKYLAEHDGLRRGHPGRHDHGGPAPGAGRATASTCGRSAGAGSASTSAA